jgi:hypothetical protein
MWWRCSDSARLTLFAEQLARFISNPGVVHFNAAMRVLT